MKGKMITAVVATALIVGFSAMNASAWNHGGAMMGHGMMNGGYYNANVNRQTQDEINKIQVKLAGDQAELSAIMSSANPDSQLVRTLSEQVATGEIALQNKTAGSGNGYNMMGPGMMNGGYGCW